MTITNLYSWLEETLVSNKSSKMELELGYEMAVDSMKMHSNRIYNDLEKEVLFNEINSLIKKVHLQINSSDLEVKEYRLELLEGFQNILFIYRLVSTPAEALLN